MVPRSPQERLIEELRQVIDAQRRTITELRASIDTHERIIASQQRIIDAALSATKNRPRAGSN
jgi:uncharacterized coiled-coil protein SlyX